MKSSISQSTGSIILSISSSRDIPLGGASGEASAGRGLSTEDGVREGSRDGTERYTAGSMGLIGAMLGIGSVRIKAQDAPVLYISRVYSPKHHATGHRNRSSAVSDVAAEIDQCQPVFWGLEPSHGCLELHHRAVDQCPPSSVNMHFLCFIGVLEAMLDMSKIAPDSGPARATDRANFEASNICKREIRV